MQRPSPDPAGGAHPTKPFTIIHAIHKQSAPFVPFAHALSLAYAAKGELEIVDVSGAHRSRSDLGVRDTLEQWGILARGSKREDVAEIGLRVKKIIKKGDERKEIGKRLRRSDHDILVIGVEPRTGIGRLFGKGLTEYLIQYLRQTTLYVPLGVKPFVDLATGAVSLNKIIMPVADEPSPKPSLEMLQRLLRIFPQGPSEVVGLHVGKRFPYVPASLLEGVPWREITQDRKGEHLSHVITRTAEQEDADLMIMSTNGRDTFSQKIVGSITEQVLRRTSCPVLAVAVT